MLYQYVFQLPGSDVNSFGHALYFFYVCGRCILLGSCRGSLFFVSPDGHRRDYGHCNNRKLELCVLCSLTDFFKTKTTLSGITKSSVLMPYRNK
jgi:hypothetical protein